MAAMGKNVEVCWMRSARMSGWASSVKARSFIKRRKSGIRILPSKRLSPGEMLCVLAPAMGLGRSRSSSSKHPNNQF